MKLPMLMRCDELIDHAGSLALAIASREKVIARRQTEGKTSPIAWRHRQRLVTNTMKHFLGFALEAAFGWLRVSRGRTSVQINYYRPSWATGLRRIDVRRDVPTAAWRVNN
jgi:hypothetical protein